MDTDYRPVAERRQGSKRVAGKARSPRRNKGWLSWLCNPLVLKTIIALARVAYELIRRWPRH